MRENQRSAARARSKAYALHGPKDRALINPNRDAAATDRSTNSRSTLCNAHPAGAHGRLAGLVGGAPSLLCFLVSGDPPPLVGGAGAHSSAARRRWPLLRGLALLPEFHQREDGEYMARKPRWRRTQGRWWWRSRSRGNTGLPASSSSQASLSASVMPSSSRGVYTSHRYASFETQI